MKFEETFEPAYFRHFFCNGPECPDTCCSGWDIVIDAATSQRYASCEDVRLKALFSKYLDFERKSTIPSQTYVKLEQQSCPFLTEERFCQIQQRLGEDALSLTCSTYPRFFNQINGVLERSLCISCFKAAQLILLNKEPMQFIRSKEPVILRPQTFGAIRSSSEVMLKPYAYFATIREFVFELLQNRDYPLWQRLSLLSVFCSRLGQVQEQYYEEDIPYLLSYFRDRIQHDDFRQAMDVFETDLETQLQVLIALLNYRMQGDFIGERFQACMHAFMQGLGMKEYTVNSDVVEAYALANQQYYLPFLKEHEYVLENYLVNSVFTANGYYWRHERFSEGIALKTSSAFKKAQPIAQNNRLGSSISFVLTPWQTVRPSRRLPAGQSGPDLPVLGLLRAALDRKEARSNRQRGT